VAAHGRSAGPDHRRKQRLAGNAALQRSIRHRFPYIDPLHHLQVELWCARYRRRAGRRVVRTGIHISINGIAAGLAQYRLTGVGM
jgi:phosphoenolpyruvate carboxylase